MFFVRVAFLGWMKSTVCIWCVLYCKCIWFWYRVLAHYRLRCFTRIVLETMYCMYCAYQRIVLDSLHFACGAFYGSIPIVQQTSAWFSISLWDRNGTLEPGTSKRCWVAKGGLVRQCILCCVLWYLSSCTFCIECNVLVVQYAVCIVYYCT